MATPAAGQAQPPPEAAGAPAHAAETRFNIVLPALNTRRLSPTSSNATPPPVVPHHDKPEGADSELTPNETKSEPRPTYKMKRTGRPGFLSANLHARNGSETPTPTSATIPATPPIPPIPPKTIVLPLPTSAVVDAQSETNPAPQVQPLPQPQSKPPRVKLSKPKPVCIDVDSEPQSTVADGEQNGIKRRRDSASDTTIPKQKRLKANRVILKGAKKTDAQDLTISLLSDSSDSLSVSDSNADGETEQNGDSNEKNDIKDDRADGAEEGDNGGKDPIKDEEDRVFVSEEDDVELSNDESMDIDESDDDTVESVLTENDSESENASDGDAESRDGEKSPTTTSDRSSRTRNSYSISLTKAPSGRPYNRYRDTKGIELSTKGAIIPDRSHRSENLNDNLDGTLTIMSVQPSDLPQGAARVVSQRKLSDLEPLIEPKVKTTDLHLSETKIDAQAEKGEVAETKTEIQGHKKSASHSKKVKKVKKDAPGHVSKKVQKIKQPLKELQVSASGREYSNSIFGGRNFGVLFPDGYKLGTHSHLPWICPVRDCQRVTMAIHNLGGHFVTKHKFTQFNDNGDGTLSVVGPHTRSRSIIVSQRVRPASELEPLAKQYPIGSKPNETDAVESAGALKPMTAAETRANMDDLWDYAKTFLSEAMRAVGMPNNGKAALYLTAPRVRELRWNKKLVRNKNTEMHATHLAGLLIQLTGEEAEEPCDQCKKGQGPFEGCITVNSNGRPEMLVAYDACANCATTYGRVPCSLRFEARKRFARLYPHLDYNKLAEQPFKIQKAFGKQPGPSPANTPVQDNSTSDTSDNEPLVRSAGLRMFGDPDGKQGLGSGKMRDKLARRQQERITDGGESTPSSMALSKTMRKMQDSPLLLVGEKQPLLEMEDWEVAPGRVQATTCENIAFSNAYLTSSQMVPINHNMSYRIEVVRPGSKTSFEADTWFTRTCTLASGKLRVTVGDADFVIGPHGMFLVAPGKSFAVQNRLYIDAYLHITALRNP